MARVGKKESVKKARLEPEIAQRSTFLSSILLHIPHMVFVKEAQELRFVLFNQAGEDLLGVKMSDLMGKNDYDFFPKEQADAFTAADRKVLAGKQTVVIEEEPIDSPGKGRRYLRTKKVPIVDEAGKPLYLLGISEDMTEVRTSRLLIEDQRLALANSAKLSALGEMAGGIAHEINNPLAIIIGLSGRLRIQHRRNTLTPALVSDTCDKIEATVARASKVINSMQIISRDGSQDPLVQCNVDHIIEGTLYLCSEKFRNHGVELSYVSRLAPNHQVMARATEISQVMLNLIQNAFDAVQSQSATNEKVVRVEAIMSRGSVVIKVVDSGDGIPESVRGKLMQPFFTTKPVGKGTGLGLSISRGILARHGGQLRFNPAESQTTFEIVFPISSTYLPKVS